MSTPSISAKARDLTLRLTDSCNCSSSCCFRKAPKSPEVQKVFVTSLGTVVQYDPSKGDETLALRKSMINLMAQVDRLAERRVESTEKVSKYIEEIASQAYQTGSALTLAEVNRIKRAVAVHLMTGPDEEAKKD